LSQTDSETVLTTVFVATLDLSVQKFGF